MRSDISPSTFAYREQDKYEEFLEQVRQHFDAVTGNHNGIVFTTNATGLFETFLNNLPDEARQHYTCHACRNFFERYGGIVSMFHDGDTVPVMWDSRYTPEFFKKPVDAIKNIVSKSKVNGVFLSSDKVWGTPVTGVWHHIAIAPPPSMTFNSVTQTASQKMAEKREDFKNLIAGLLEYPISAIDQAITLLKTDSLYRSEKCLGVAEWLRDLRAKRDATKNTVAKENLVWLAVATAPAGFCHIKSTMIGTLLDDIVAGLPFDSVAKRFADKMHPLQYQRPQAAPTDGNIAQAEKIVVQLGATGSLARRFARLNEIQTIWKPAEKHTEEPKREGVFSHLATKSQQPAIGGTDIPPITITWKKFHEMVLPTTKSLEFCVEMKRDNYSAILTAVNFDAPPILQWDSPENRNPFSWYVYHGGSSPSDWNLELGYHKVTGVCFQPSMWNSGLGHQGKSVIFILEGAKDTRYKHSGNALFPECLKSEFRSIRATIEAYSHNAELQGYEEASACGIRLQHGDTWNALFRVTSGSSAVTYRLDRWD